MASVLRIQGENQGLSLRIGQKRLEKLPLCFGVLNSSDWAKPLLRILTKDAAVIDTLASCTKLSCACLVLSQRIVTQQIPGSTADFQTILSFYSSR